MMQMLPIKEDISLQKYNTFGLDVKARWFVEVKEIEEFKQAIQWAHNKQVEVNIFGGGSNVLLTGNLDSLVIVNRIQGIQVTDEDDDQVTISVSSGEVWHDLVMYCTEKNWGGIENMSLIPGTVGAAPMQNIGAYGMEIKDVFVSLEALHLETLEYKTFSADACEFGYRESVFKQDLKNQYFICSVSLILKKNPVVNTSYGAITEVLSRKGIKKPSIRDVSEAVMEIRRSKLPDPAQIGNSGSFFKNPVIDRNRYETLKQKYVTPGYIQEDGYVKVPAGWLIEHSGWKGKRFGEVGVHDKQALVLVNHGGGNGQDIYDLALKIQASVKEKFDIDIFPEVNIL